MIPLDEASVNLAISFAQFVISVSTAPAAPWIVGFSVGCWLGGWSAAKNAFWPIGFMRAALFGAMAGGTILFIQIYALGGGAV